MTLRERRFLMIPVGKTRLHVMHEIETLAPSVQQEGEYGCCRHKLPNFTKAI